MIITHIFDLWGVLVDSEKMGQRLGTAHNELIDLLSGEEREKAVQDRINYEAVLTGEAWAIGRRKKGYCDTYEETVWRAHYQKLVQVDTDDVFYSDAISTLDTIFSGGQTSVVLTTGNSTQWFMEAFDKLGLSAAICHVYSGDKSTFAPFVYIGGVLVKRGYVLISHTEDSLAVFPHLATASSILGRTIQGVYVEKSRTLQDETKTNVEAMGLLYATSLLDIDYLRLAL
jgi:hypothetical protein